MLRRGKLAGTRRLDLSCGLSQFPTEIYDLADSLKILNLSGNALDTLPDDLSRLHRLRVIFCSDNLFSEVPEVLGSCPSLEMIGFKANRIAHFSAAAIPSALRWLILTDNRLEQLPAELGASVRLQKLMLAGNQLRELPDALAACRNLELLRISANRFEKLPAWLSSLPRLAWLAFAGNPLQPAYAAETRSVHWGDLELAHRLGEGASGIIHKAVLRAPDGDKEVAVKLFKGAVTSDGLPGSEKAACLAAGSHPNLIAASGRIVGHPERVAGLVMPLVGEGFGNLAGPPSLESCTRDIYPDDAHFSLQTLLSIAGGVASAAEHLHRMGIMHGDLYAHNLLWNAAGDCLLGDFGAASFVSQDAAAFERIEVRAFGCLLQELLERCDAPRQAATDMLWELQRACDLADVGARPRFYEILQALSEIRRSVAG